MPRNEREEQGTWVKHRSLIFPPFYTEKEQISVKSLYLSLISIFVLYLHRVADLCFQQFNLKIFLLQNTQHAKKKKKQQYATFKIQNLFLKEKKASLREWIRLLMFCCCLVSKSQRRQWHPTPVLLPGKSHGRRSLVGCSPWGREESDTTERLHFHFPALKKEMTTHSSVLAWRIPGMGEPGGLPSLASHRVGHDWRDLAAAAVSKSCLTLLPSHGL